jgi:DNA modification methylase
MKKLLFGDWEERIQEYYGSEPSFDLIFYDPPYGVTNEKWDKPFGISKENYLWEFLKPNGVIAVFSNDIGGRIRNNEWEKELRYKWYWRKTQNGNWVHSAHKPMSVIEEISIFSEGLCTHNSKEKAPFNSTPVTNLLEYASVGSREKIHPCQKPLDLCKFIIECYTKPGDRVLDICCGSGTIPQAAKLSGRDFLGIEKEESFFVDAEHRLRHKDK